MLSTHCSPLLSEHDAIFETFFQQDVAPPHIALPMKRLWNVKKKSLVWSQLPLWFLTGRDKSWFITDGVFLLGYLKRKVYAWNSWTSKSWSKRLRNKFKISTKTCWQKCWTACPLVSTGWFSVKGNSFDSKDFNQVSRTFFKKREREIEKEGKKKSGDTKGWVVKKERERKWEPPLFWTTCQLIYKLTL